MVQAIQRLHHEETTLFSGCRLLAGPLFLTPAPEGNPERAGNEDRRIAAARETDQQRKGEILCRITAEIVKCQRREEHRTYGID